MKKSSFLFLLCFLSNSTFGWCQSSIAPRAGVNFSSRLFKENGTVNSSEYDWVTGFHIGADYEYEFNDIVSLSAGVLLNSRGYKSYATVNYTNGSVSPPESSTHRLEFKQRFMYLDIPISLKLKYEIDRQSYFFGRIGAYAGYTLSGNYTNIGIVADTTGIYFFPDQIQYDLGMLNEPRLDVGANFSFGVEIHKFFFEAFYSLGLRNMANENYTDLIARNRAVLLSLGYRFEF